ncbi:MAG: hypothetical protein WAQ52_05145 [Terriglobales bacterium]
MNILAKLCLFFLSVLLIILSELGANAQSWALGGNTNTNPTTDFLGTLDNKPLIIKTNGFEAIRVTPALGVIEGAQPISSGLVGIGTDRPTAVLHINAAGQARIGLKIEGEGLMQGFGAFPPIIQLDAGGVRNWQLIAAEGSVLGNSGTLRGKLLFYTSSSQNSAVPLVLTGGGNVGIGTFDPGATLQVVAPNQLGLIVQGPGQGPSAVGAGIQLEATRVRNWELLATGEGASQGSGKLNIRNLGDALDVFTITGDNNVGIGTTTPTSKLQVNGTATVAILQITGGNDLAEPFEITGAEAIKPGIVVAIDPDRPGRLRIADRAYDRTVIGIASGANGIKPGLTMNRGEAEVDRSLLVSLTGRVYCWADASYGPIKPGDLLTTSDTPGYAMRVTDYTKSQGAIIGKAMTSLQNGQGLVLVLVSLQ